MILVHMIDYGLEFHLGQGREYMLDFVGLIQVVAKMVEKLWVD